jgi:sugar O-acyltransferase (sialic acid O-acetyltransferase NeuD family)
MRSLVVVHTGGFGRETVEAVRAVNQQQPTWELIGFLDEREELAGTQVDGLPVLGPIAELDRYGDAQVVVCTGGPQDYFSRRRIVQRLDLPPDRYATVVHPAIVLPPSCQVGPGSVLLAGMVATTSVRIGAHVAVEAGVVLSHDDVVGSFATLGPGVRLAGTVEIGEGAYVGAGAVIHQERTVGAWSLIGMGAVVLDDVPAAEVWVGVPARRLRAVELPTDLTAPEVS